MSSSAAPTTSTEQAKHLSTSERLLALDTKLYQQLADSQIECEQMNKILLPVQDVKLTALRNMCKKASAELQKVHEAKLDATLDVMEHCVTQIEELRSVLATLQQQVRNTARFAASAYCDSHASLMPHLSQEELDCINGLNQFIPRASTDGCP